MPDYKAKAAKAALQLIKPNQTIGLGAGSTIAHLVELISNEKHFAQFAYTYFFVVQNN